MQAVGSTAPGGLTVVMPLYNKAQHVARAIDSVLAQVGGFDALIVVDDGSTDGGTELVAAQTDPRIRLLKRSPPGPGGYAARNLAIREATTDWIAFLDADDAWAPGFTAAIAGLIERHGDAIGCAFTSYELRDPTGLTRRQTFGADRAAAGPATLDFNAFLDAWLHYRDSPIWTGATAFRRDVLIQAGLFPEGRCRRGGDKDLWLRALALRPAAFDPRPLATYYRDATNMVTATTKIDCAHCVVQTIEEMLTSAPAASTDRLKGLSNMETLNYCIAAARTGTLNASIYQRYYDDPWNTNSLLIGLLRRTPVAVRPFVGTLMARTLARVS